MNGYMRVGMHMLSVSSPTRPFLPHPPRHRAVPCHRRATAFAKEYVAETEVEGFDGSADDGTCVYICVYISVCCVVLCCVDVHAWTMHHSTQPTAHPTHPKKSGEGWLATHVVPPSSSSETNTIQNAPGVLEEVDLGSTAAVVASPPEGAVLVDGHGQEEEEEPGATVLLAPGMVTVVYEHFGAGGAEVS